MAEPCPHPAELVEGSISHFGDPDFGYCRGCQMVLHLEAGAWVALPTGITKATYRFAKAQNNHSVAFVPTSRYGR